MSYDCGIPLTMDPKVKIVEQKVWYEWKPIFCQKCLQVGHTCVDKQAAPIQIQKKSQGQGQRKEWIPTTSKAQGIQVENNTQEKSDHEEDETTQEQIDKAIVNAEWVNKMATQQEDPVNPIIQEGHASPIIQEGLASPIIHEGPTSPIIHEGPASPIIQEGPTSTIINEGPATTIIQEGPALPLSRRVLLVPLSRREGPASHIIYEGPVNLIMQEGPASPIIQEGPANSIIQEGPANPIIHEGPASVPLSRTVLLVSHYPRGSC
ncbi:hypothetical protein H5410_045765 [Solanum commersonii]|uniref:Uncharacterized protein n=1 Tax=Solanum commersonii TaxID=4109 RepID=A0A9J5XAG9_SOLCO|nr:hypothetical protein H5410_045765 [Solanum commersonii]